MFEYSGKFHWSICLRICPFFPAIKTQDNSAGYRFIDRLGTYCCLDIISWQYPAKYSQFQHDQYQFLMVLAPPLFHLTSRHLRKPNLCKMSPILMDYCLLFVLTQITHIINKTWLGWNLWTMDKICKYIYISILICIVFMGVNLYVNILSDNCLWIIMITLMLCKTITFQLCTHGFVALSYHRKHCYLCKYMAACFIRFWFLTNKIPGPRFTSFLPSLIWCCIKIDRKKFWDN